jgi:hypothetical protein
MFMAGSFFNRRETAVEEVKEGTSFFPPVILSDLGTTSFREAPSFTGII